MVLGQLLGNLEEAAVRGNIEQRGDDRWRLRVFVGRENGRTKLVTCSFRGTKSHAETELAKFVADVERNQVAVSHAGSLQDLLIRRLDAIDPDRSRYTIKEYKRLVVPNIGPAIGSVRLAKLTGARLDGFCAAFGSFGNQDHVRAPAVPSLATATGFPRIRPPAHGDKEGRWIWPSTDGTRSLVPATSSGRCEQAPGRWVSPDHSPGWDDAHVVPRW
jgi:hypothetical protein